MCRFITILFILILLLISCQKDHSTTPFNHDRDSPEWLRTKIDSISKVPEYIGTKVYRYEWKENLIYHIEIPISSCAYCELYNHSGTKIEMSDDEMFHDFLENKKNKVLVWEWK